MNASVTSDPRLYDAVIFELDRVVTETALIHAVAWAAMFDDFSNGAPRATTKTTRRSPMTTTGNSWTASHAMTA